MATADELAAARAHAALLPETQREIASTLIEVDRFHFAQQLLDRGHSEFDALRAACRQMARVLPASPLVFRTMAFCEARAGAYDEVCQALGRFIQIDPGAGYDSRRELLRLEWLRPGSTPETRVEVARIALVGNGPSVLGGNLGAEIESHD